MFKFNLCLLIVFIQFFVPAAFAKEKGIDATITGQSGLFYMPNDVEPGTYGFNLDEAVIERPTLWGLSAKLDQDLVIPTSKGDVTVGSGTIMPALTVLGVPGVGENMVVFCTERRGGFRTDVNYGFGASRSIWDSTRDGQICILDSNVDGKADFGFLINSGTREDRIPKSISNIALNVEELRPAGDGYKVKILFWLVTPLAFHLEIYHNGEKIPFDSITSGDIYQKRDTIIPDKYILPYEARVFGAKFNILSVERKKKKITVSFIENDKNILISIPIRSVTTFR